MESLSKDVVALISLVQRHKKSSLAAVVVVIVVISGVKRGTLQGRYERKILVAAKKRCSYHSSLSIAVLLLLLLLFGPKAVQRCQWCHSVVSLEV